MNSSLSRNTTHPAAEASSSASDTDFSFLISDISISRIGVFSANQIIHEPFSRENIPSGQKGYSMRITFCRADELRAKPDAPAARSYHLLLQCIATPPRFPFSSTRLWHKSCKGSHQTREKENRLGGKSVTRRGLRKEDSQRKGRSGSEETQTTRFNPGPHGRVRPNPGGSDPVRPDQTHESKAPECCAPLASLRNDEKEETGQSGETEKNKADTVALQESCSLPSRLLLSLKREATSPRTRAEALYPLEPR